MPAWTHHTAGILSKVLSLSDDIPRPSLKSPNQVLVRVPCAALNPGGSIMMQLCPSFLCTKPRIPEIDFAGYVVRAEESLASPRGFKLGTAVFGSIPVPDHLKGLGSLGEYVVVETPYVMDAPKGVELQEAAGLAVAGGTALSLLEIT